uniref:glycosyltransferase family 2 protein n=1 Tax=Candidatus Enterococcus willemsii TaxID=1857215 RepID=UPI00403F82B2
MISVIIACYNSEAYIKKNLDSLLNQDKISNFEIICINDGSQDNTLKILTEYQDKYPNKIKVFSTENRGASSARNFGLEKISKESEIITFVDSDDIVSKKFLLKARAFFRKHPQIKVAVTPIFYFGVVNKQHGLNWRFRTKKSVIDIQTNPEYIHFNLGGTFFRRECFHQQCIFDENLNFWEDALFINRIILNEKKYGLIYLSTSSYQNREIFND